MITNEQIVEIIKDCSKKGHIVTTRDIAYALLCIHFEDSLVAYKCVFGYDKNYCEEYHNTYDNTDMMVFLKTYIDISVVNKKRKRTKDDDISFEENKAYMLKLKRDTEDAMANQEIDKKDGLKILAQISTTLNDKFKVSSEDVQQRIFVNKKFNSICSNCGKELYIPTKEDLMEKYDLVEKE